MWQSPCQGWGKNSLCLFNRNRKLLNDYIFSCTETPRIVKPFLITVFVATANANRASATFCRLAQWQI